MSTTLDKWLDPAFDDMPYIDGPIGDNGESADNGEEPKDRDSPTADDWQDVFDKNSEADIDQDTDTPSREDWDDVFDSGGSDSENDDSKEDGQRGDSEESEGEDREDKKTNKREPGTTKGKASGEGTGIDIALTIEKFLELGLKLIPRIVDIARGGKFDDVPIKVPTGGKPGKADKGRKKGERETIEIQVLDEIKRLVDGQ